MIGNNYYLDTDSTSQSHLSLPLLHCSPHFSPLMHSSWQSSSIPLLNRSRVAAICISVHMSRGIYTCVGIYAATALLFLCMPVHVYKFFQQPLTQPPGPYHHWGALPKSNMAHRGKERAPASQLVIKHCVCVCVCVPVYNKEELSHWTLSSLLRISYSRQKLVPLLPSHRLLLWADVLTAAPPPTELAH